MTLLWANTTKWCTMCAMTYTDVGDEGIEAGEREPKR